MSDSILFKYSKALAESILSQVVPLSAVSRQDIERLAKELLDAYEKEGKPYGDTEEGLYQYLLNTKIIVKGKGDVL